MNKAYEGSDACSVRMLKLFLICTLSCFICGSDLCTSLLYRCVHYSINDSCGFFACAYYDDRSRKNDLNHYKL